MVFTFAWWQENFFFFYLKSKNFYAIELKVHFKRHYLPVWTLACTLVTWKGFVHIWAWGQKTFITFRSALINQCNPLVWQKNKDLSLGSLWYDIFLRKEERGRSVLHIKIWKCSCSIQLKQHCIWARYSSIIKL